MWLIPLGDGVVTSIEGELPGSFPPVWSLESTRVFVALGPGLTTFSLDRRVLERLPSGIEHPTPLIDFSPEANHRDVSMLTISVRVSDERVARTPVASVARDSDGTIKAEEAEGAFKALLALAGVNLLCPDLAETWSVFKDFLGVPDSSGTDGVLFESGCHRSGLRFSISFLRQFDVRVEGEHGYFFHMHCEFFYSATEDLSALPGCTEWWFRDDDVSLEDFVEVVERRPAFRMALGLVPLEVHIGQTPV